MNKSIENIIEEAFASKKQQRYFYAKANDKTLSKHERNKWKKMAKEFSSKTNFKKIPDEIEEIVDSDGNINRGSKTSDISTKGITSKSTTDKAVKTGTGQIGTFGISGGIKATNLLKYLEEEDFSDALGFDQTMGSNKTYKDAENYFEKELELPKDETEERLEKMGYDKNLPEDKIRLVENPKEYIEAFVERLLAKRSKENDIVTKKSSDIFSGEKEINPIIKRQFKTLCNTIENNDLPVRETIDLLFGDE